MTIRLSTKNIFKWYIYLHDPKHFSFSQLMVYGKDLINVVSSVVSGTSSEYIVEPVEVNHINQDGEPCQGSQTTGLWECIADHIYSKLNCTLPWSPPGHPYGKG